MAGCWTHSVVSRTNCKKLYTGTCFQSFEIGDPFREKTGKSQRFPMLHTGKVANIECTVWLTITDNFIGIDL